MRPQPGEQTVAKHTLPNISPNKGNQTLKHSQQNITREIFFLKIFTEIQTGKLVPDQYGVKRKLNMG